MRCYSQPLLQHVAEEINRTTNLLGKETDLSPANQITNTLLTNLVKNLSQWSTHNEVPALLTYSCVQDALYRLPKICSRAECEMEKWWALRLVSSADNIWQSLEEFWYIKQYRELVKGELALLKSTNIKSFVFLGSGALPLTAILLAKTFLLRNVSYKIICIDSDPLACDLSQTLIQRCKLESYITVLNIPAENYKPHKDSLVICASLLKAENLYRHLFDLGVKHLMVRDVEGIFRFLYELAPIPQAELYSEVARTNFCEYRINISRYFRKMETR